MIKTSTEKIKDNKKKDNGKKISNDITVDRRTEWRIDLPLAAVIEGSDPEGKNFHEKTMLENISSTGAYFCLNASITVGSQLNLIIEVPGKLSEGKKIKLCLEGIAIRLEDPNKANKKQAVALRFIEEFRFQADEKKES